MRCAGISRASPGGGRQRTLLLIVMRNATTDSPWPLSNNPNAAYNRAGRRAKDTAGNLDLPGAVRTASTAAPTCFHQATHAGGPGEFLMSTGGSRIPQSAFLVFLNGHRGALPFAMANRDGNMLVVSIGTRTDARPPRRRSPTGVTTPTSPPAGYGRRDSATESRRVHDLGSIRYLDEPQPVGGKVAEQVQPEAFTGF